MKKLNKKGFTLVELLAVIVVLGFILVLTVPSVLTAMNTARQSSFLLYAEKMLNVAQTRYQTDMLTTTMPDEYCYNIAELTDGQSNQYFGFVHVTNGSKTTATYKIKMFNNTYSVGMKADTTLGDAATGVSYSEIESIKSKLKGTTTLQSKSDYFSTSSTTLDSPCGTVSSLTKGDNKLDSTGKKAS